MLADFSTEKFFFTLFVKFNYFLLDKYTINYFKYVLKKIFINIYLLFILLIYF